MDRQNPAPPKKHWNDDAPVNANKRRGVSTMVFNFVARDPFSQPSTACQRLCAPIQRRSRWISRWKISVAVSGHLRGLILTPQKIPTHQVYWPLQEWSDSPHFTQGETPPNNKLGLMNMGSTLGFYRIGPPQIVVSLSQIPKPKILEYPQQQP